MFPPLLGIPEWFKNGFQWILDALQAILDALNPLLYILKVLDMLISVLPAPADLTEFYNSYETIMNWLAPSLQLANHFINLPVFAVAFLAIMTVETSFSFFRLWRMLRSVVT